MPSFLVKGFVASKYNAINYFVFCNGVDGSLRALTLRAIAAQEKLQAYLLIALWVLSSISISPCTARKWELLTKVDNGPVFLMQLLQLHVEVLVPCHIYAIGITEPSPERPWEVAKLMEEITKDCCAIE